MIGHSYMAQRNSVQTTSLVWINRVSLVSEMNVMKREISNYALVVAALKAKIRFARQKALLNINTQLLEVYHAIGQAVLEQRIEEGWGTRVIDNLSADLKREFPDMKGFSVRNIKYMRAFAKAWPGAIFVQQPSAQIQLTRNQSTLKVQEAIAQIPWGHHQALLDKVKVQEEREFYLIKTIENQWSRSVLVHQIESNLFHRQGKAITNFDRTIIPPQSDLVNEILKSPYNLEFTGLTEHIQERELEKALIAHIQKFLLELGRGFAFVGTQINFVVDGDDYFPDLLFFNYLLNRFVVLELKVDEFKPEYAGKLNFYVTTVDKQLTGPDHKPAVGLLLCKTPNKTVVQYSLTGIDSPIGVSEYELSKAIPEVLKREILSVEELEAEIDKEYEELMSPSEKRLEGLKQKIAALHIEPMQTASSFSVLCELFDKSLHLLYEQLIRRLKDFNELFLDFSYSWQELPEVNGLENLGPQWRTEHYLKNRAHHNFQYRLIGFKAGGPSNAYDIYSQLTVITDPHSYSINLTNYRDNPIIQRFYHQQLTKENIKQICDKVCDMVLEQLDRRLTFEQRAGVA